jgi:hypothetical protein
MLKFAAMLLLLPVVYAQDTRASIWGVVKDSSEENLDGVKVTIVNLATKLEVTTATTAQGYYAIPSLAPGKYELRMEAEGCRKYTRQNLVLRTQDKLRVDVILERGESNDRVVVKDTLKALPTESATRSETLSNELLTGVPTQNRNPFDVAWAVNGVMKSGIWRYARPLDIDATSRMSIGNGISQENDVLVDGQSIVGGGREVLNLPGMDAIQELNVQASPYDTQHGRIAGGVVSVTTKSGGTQLHGVLFEYLQTDKLNANQSAANQFGLGRMAGHSNQFGGQVSGPVPLPKDSASNNHLFFSLDWERLKQHSTEANVTTVPTAAARNGDFSSLYNRLGQQVVIYDPNTTKIYDSSGVKTSGLRTPFAGNAIPKSRLDPVAQKVLSLYPSASMTGNARTHVNNYAYTSDGTATATQFLGRVDYVLNSKNRFFARYGQNPWSEQGGAFFKTANAAEPSGDVALDAKGSNFLVDWTSTRSALTTVDLRVGANRWRASNGSLLGAGYNPTQLGFSPALVSQFSRYQFPNFNLNDFQSLGGEVYGTTVRNAYSIEPSMSHVWNKHLLKLGLELRRYERNESARGYPSGQYNYGKVWSQASATLGDGISGDSVASFLLGVPTSANVANEIAPGYTHFYYAGYFHDDFRLTSRLTVNIGVRYNVETANMERYNRMFRSIDLNVKSPIADSVANLSLKGQVQFAGTHGQRRTAFNTDYNNVQPRLGLAYRVTDKLVVRLGYGLFYMGQDETGPTEGFSRTTNALTTSDGLTPYAGLTNANAFVGYTNGKLLSPIGTSMGTASFLGETIAPNLVTRGLPRTQQYSVDIERELPGHALFQMGYVVSETTQLPVNADLNYIPSVSMDRMTTTGVLDTSYYVAPITNPMKGLIPNNLTLNGTTVMRAATLVAYPQFSGVTLNNASIGKETYRAASMNVSKRYSNGLSLMAGVTVSKNLERLRMQNPQGFSIIDWKKTSMLLNEPVQESDVPVRFVTAGVFEMPFGKGRRFATDANPVLDQIIGGWQLGWSATYQKGFVLTYPNAPQAQGGSAKLASGTRSAAQWLDTSLWVSPTTNYTVTVPNLTYQTRTFPFLFSDVRGPDYQNFNLSVSKLFPIREHVKLQLRGEAVNLLNYAWFADVHSTDVTSAYFGQQSPVQNNLPRSVKLALRLMW